MRFTRVSLTFLTLAVIASASCSEKNKKSDESSTMASPLETLGSWTSTAALGIMNGALGTGGTRALSLLLPPNLVSLSETSYNRIEEIVQKSLSSAFFNEVRADLTALQGMEIKGYSRSKSDPKRSLATVQGYCESLASVIARLKNHDSYGVSSMIQATYLYGVLSEERIQLLNILGDKEEAASRGAALRETMGNLANHLQTQLDTANNLYEEQLRQLAGNLPKLNPRTGTWGGNACLDIPGKPCFYSPLSPKHLEMATAEVTRRRAELKEAMGGEEALVTAIKGARAWQTKAQ